MDVFHSVLDRISSLFKIIRIVKSIFDLRYQPSDRIELHTRDRKMTKYASQSDVKLGIVLM